jgi:hypothetical protein
MSKYALGVNVAVTTRPVLSCSKAVQTLRAFATVFSSGVKASCTSSADIVYLNLEDPRPALYTPRFR